MLKIGFNKKDPDCRKFYFDDSTVLTSNPPNYKVWYLDDENDIDYVFCSDVFYLKPAPNQPKNEIEKSLEQVVQNNQLSGKITAPIDDTIKQSTISKPEPPKDTIYLDKVDIISDGKKVEIVTQPKKRGRKKKETEEKSITSTCSCDTSIQFEYKVIDEYLETYEKLEIILNEMGQDGWELCGFEIFKTGITKPNSVMCIMKRRL